MCGFIAACHSSASFRLYSEAKLTREVEGEASNEERNGEHQVDSTALGLPRQVAGGKGAEAADDVWWRRQKLLDDDRAFRIDRFDDARLRELSQPLPILASAQPVSRTYQEE